MFCPMWVKIDIRNLIATVRENRCRDVRTFVVGTNLNCTNCSHLNCTNCSNLNCTNCSNSNCTNCSNLNCTNCTNLNCIYACTLKGYDSFKTKFALETSVTSHRWRKRDVAAVQHIQWRAQTLSRRHAHLITTVHDLLTEKFSVQIKVKLPLSTPWRYRSTHSWAQHCLEW